MTYFLKHVQVCVELKTNIVTKHIKSIAAFLINCIAAVAQDMRSFKRRQSCFALYGILSGRLGFLEDQIVSTEKNTSFWAFSWYRLLNFLHCWESMAMFLRQFKCEIIRKLRVSKLAWYSLYWLYFMCLYVSDLPNATFQLTGALFFVVVARFSRLARR